MQSVSQFSIVRSGYPFSVQNTVGIASGGAISITYTISGAPGSLTIQVEGCKNSIGVVALLDTYNGTSGTTRSISLSDTYDYFQITANWTGGNNVGVAVSMTIAGPGLSLTAVQQQFPISGSGSPQGVVSAPLGTIYTSITGGSNVTAWVKESGGSTASGWTAK
jgi:hypothetical protein